MRSLALAIPAKRLQRSVERRLRRERPQRPEARRRADDDPWVDGAQTVVVEPEIARGAGPEVLGDDVGALDQPPHDLAARGRAHVDRHAALVAVEADVEAALGLAVRILLAGRAEERRDQPCGIAFERLDLDHLGAEVAEQGGAERAGDEGAEVENAKPGERTAVGVGWHRLTENNRAMTERRASFRRFAIATIAAVYFLIFVGGLVRASGSGMGCPDWPKCFGRWVPPTSESQLPADYQERWAEHGYGEARFNVWRTWTEYGNRMIGVVIGFLILATLLLSLRFRREDPALVWWCAAALVLVGFNGWLGSVVVSTNLEPWIITAHMLAALAVVAALLLALEREARHELAAARRRGDARRPRGCSPPRSRCRSCSW